MATEVVTEDDLSEQGRDLLPDESVMTDGGIAFSQFRAFERDLLYAVRALERGGDTPPKGLDVKSYLDREYGEEVNHSRLYQNLDRLVEKHLLEKAEKDGRTNEYMTTDTAEQLLTEHAQRRADAVGLDGGDRA